MRLLVVGVRWPPETFIWRRLVRLVAAGFEVSVATPSTGARPLAAEPRIRPISVPHWSTPAPRLVAGLAAHSVRAVVGSADARQFLVGALRDRVRPALLRRSLPLLHLRPDVVHFEWPSAAIAYLPLWDLWRAPVVISCRGTEINVRPLRGEPEYLDGLRVVLGRAAAVHCVSSAIRDVAVPLGLDPAKATVIRPAVDTRLFSPGPAREPDRALTVVATGSWLWVKGYEYALLALRRLVDGGLSVRLRIVGDGAERQRMLYTIEDLGLRDHVELLGRRSPEELVEILRTADIGLLSSVSEGISNSILEAMAVGLPVVCTDVGGMREVVTDGEEGFVVPARDPEALADAVRRLAGDRALRTRMGTAARARATRELDLELQRDRFVELYRQVAS